MGTLRSRSNHNSMRLPHLGPGNKGWILGISESRSSEEKPGGVEASEEQLIPNLWSGEGPVMETQKSRRAVLPVVCLTPKGHSKTASGSSPKAGDRSQRLLQQ